MNPLTAQPLLNAWEQGQMQHPVDQALTLLRIAFPEKSRTELAEISIGERDRLLLTIRENLFGKVLSAEETCLQCGEKIEMTFSTQDITIPLITSEPKKLEIIWQGCRLQFKLPNSFDLAAIATTPNEELARKTLITRCITDSDNNQLLDEAKLTEPLIEELELEISKHDPQAEILLDIDCPECDLHWQVLFDIASYLWSEVDAWAKRRLQEVHTLAIAYGWSETEILNLSDVRRQLYLQQVWS